MLPLGSNPNPSLLTPNPSDLNLEAAFGKLLKIMLKLQSFTKHTATASVPVHNCLHRQFQFYPQL